MVKALFISLNLVGLAMLPFLYVGNVTVEHQSPSEVEAGGTVYVMNGIYRNQNYGTVNVSTYSNMSNPHVVTIDKSGTEAGYITLKNYPNRYLGNFVLFYGY